MNWQDQLTVEPIKDNFGDLFIVNCARVSHDKWKTEFGGNDQGLLNFLARSEPPHKTPFRHARHVFRLNHYADHTEYALLKEKAADPYFGAGIIIRDGYVSLTILSMIDIIKSINPDLMNLGNNLNAFLKAIYPGVHEAFRLKDPVSQDFHEYVLGKEQLNGWLGNISFRCTAPIWLTRQLVKHQVELSWNECFSADTEVLTDKGWVLWPEVTKEHALATPELDGSSYSFEKPKRLITNDYEGKLIHIYSRDLDMLVTPNHDQYVAIYQGANGPWSNYQKLTTKKALTKKFPKTMKMPQLLLPEGTDYWEGKLYGAFIGDGSLSKDGKRIYFHVKKERKKEMLRELAEATPEYDWNESIQNDGYSYFRIYNRNNWTGDTLTKGISFYKETKSFYKGLLHGLVATDGSVSKNNSVSYSTVSSQLKTDLEKLAFIMGFDIKTHIRKGVGNWSKTYKMTFKLPKPKLLKNSEEIDYKGKVYCAETRTGLLIVRRDGKSCVSGNCSRRYVSDRPEMFMQEFRHKAPNVKQGSGATALKTDIPPVYDHPGCQIDTDEMTELMLDWYDLCTGNLYDMAPETVRGFLPLNMMTTWIWSGPEPAFWNMIHLRDEAHAQKEAQVFAQKMKVHLK